MNSQAAGPESPITTDQAVPKKQTPDGVTPDEQARLFADPGYILRRMKHRYPFLLVDKIVLWEENHIIARKNVSFNEPFFQGHFPGEPVMPGVLILEGIAQSGCIYVGHRDQRDRMIYLASISEAKFKRRVIPGDVLEYEVFLLNDKRRAGRIRGVARVGTEIAAEAEMLFAYMD